MTIDAAAAAAALLERHRTSHSRTAHGDLVLVAAGAVAERGRPAALRTAVRRLAGTTDAVLVGAGAALGGGDRALVDEAIAAVPPTEHLSMLEAAEDFLACLDPRWAWTFLAPFAASHPSLGLSTAAYAELRGLDVDVRSGRSDRTLFARQLAADRVARAGLRGALHGKDDPALRALHESRPGRDLGPTVVPCYVAAASAVDPRWGLQVFRAIEQTQWSASLYDALPLVVARAMAAGAEQALRDALDARSGDLGEDRWLDALHEAGALRDGEAIDRAMRLAEQTTEDGVAGEELGDAGFLFHVLARTGRGDRIATWARRWQIHLPALAAHLVPLRSQLRPLIESGALDALAGHDDDELAAARDTLAVASAVPWSAPPGSFLDVIGAAPR